MIRNLPLGAGLMAQSAMQQQPTRQGLLGQARGAIGGLLGGLRDQVQNRDSDEGFNLFRFRPQEGMTQGQMIATAAAGLRDLDPLMGGNFLAQQNQLNQAQIQQRQAQAAQQQEQERIAQFRASLPPEQQALFDMNPEQFTRQMAQAEFREPPQPTGFAGQIAAMGVDPASPEGQAMMQQYVQRQTERAPRQPNAREQQIANLVGQGLAPAMAANIADGVVSIRTDPVTGNMYAVNIATGAASPLDYQQGVELPGEAAAPRTLWDNREGVAGVAGAGQEAFAGIIGQVPGVDIGEGVRGTVENRQAFRTSSQDLIRSLAINPRFPVGEMERIRREISIEPRTFDSTQALESRMRSVDRSLRQRLANEQRAANDRNLPVEQRRNASRAANDIQNFLNIMGVPQGPDAGDDESIDSLISRYAGN